MTWAALSLFRAQLPTNPDGDLPVVVLVQKDFPQWKELWNLMSFGMSSETPQQRLNRIFREQAVDRDAPFITATSPSIRKDYRPQNSRKASCWIEAGSVIHQ